jgi:serine/threonine protein kinase
VDALPLTYIENWDQRALTRYQVLKRLASESTGTVYLCNDTVKQCHVRVKVMKPPEDKPTTPGIVKASPKEGVSLRSILRSGQPMPPERVARIGAALCRALAGAHAIGVAHPRLRPESVIVRAGDEVSVADFVNRKLEPIPLGALAPELRKGRQATLKSDIYAVGAILYECLTTRLPSEIPVPPSAWGNCPSALDAVIMRALDGDPEERYASISALEGALSGDFVSAEEDTRTSMFVGVPDDDTKENTINEQQTMILQVTQIMTLPIRRFPRFMLCATLFALLLEGTIAPACSGWSREAVRVAETVEVKFQFHPGWPSAHP